MLLIVIFILGFLADILFGFDTADVSVGDRFADDMQDVVVWHKQMLAPKKNC